MQRSGFPFGIISLVLVLSGLGLFMAWQYGGLGSDDESASAQDGERGIDVSRPPRDVASNPNAARRFAEASVCTSGCVSTDRTCRGLAFDESAQAQCAEQLESCRRACGAR